MKFKKNSLYLLVEILTNIGIFLCKHLSVIFVKMNMTVIQVSHFIIENHTELHRKLLEKTFMGILNSIGIEYHTQFYVSEIPALYDFKIKGKNILIEVDGDYWHCKSGTKFEVPQYDSQFSNIKNDKIKTEWAESNGYTLLRFWESDIENDRLQIVKTLIENLT